MNTRRDDFPWLTSIVSVIAVFLVSSAAYGQSSFEAPYPSPYGSYETLRLVPRAPMPTPCVIGTMYVQSPDDLWFCGDDGTGKGTWRRVGEGVWEQNGDNIYPKDTSTNPNLKVGLGTTTPATALFLQGNEAALNPWSTRLTLRNIHPNSKKSEIVFDRSTNLSDTWRVGTDFHADNGNNFYITDNSTTPRLFIDAYGRIGINNDNPQTQLHIKGNGTLGMEDTSVRLFFRDTDNTARFEIGQSAYGRLRLGVDNPGVINNDVEFIRFSKEGKVGIGPMGWEREFPYGWLHISEGLDDPTIPVAWGTGASPTTGQYFRGQLLVQGMDPKIVLTSPDRGSDEGAVLLSEVDNAGRFLNTWVLYREASSGPDQGAFIVSYAENNLMDYTLAANRKLIMTPDDRLGINGSPLPQSSTNILYDVYLYGGDVHLESGDNSTAISFYRNGDDSYTFFYTEGGRSWDGMRWVNKKIGESGYSDLMYFDPRGKVSFFTKDVSNNHALYVGANAGKSDGSQYWDVASDRRLKTNIRPLQGKEALAIVRALRPVRFKWKDPDQFDNKTHFGFLAQDVHEVMPQWVKEGPDGYLTLETEGFEAIIVETIKNLNERLQALKDRNQRLKAEIQLLEQKLQQQTRP